MGLACAKPQALGWQVTRWSVRTLSRAVVERGVVTTIHASTVHLILEGVDLQPHRQRLWKTARIDEEFRERAERVLWCYSRAEALAQEGYLVVCVDEKTAIQALEPAGPGVPAAPGHVARREWEYVRHGTAIFLLFVIVHTGRLWGRVLERNDQAHYLEALEDFRREYGGARGVYLIQDNGASHVGRATAEYFREDPWWHPVFTPKRASWLNQAEIGLGLVSGYYLRGGHWPTRQALVDHLCASWLDYNRSFAKPIQWTWTNDKFREWYRRHAVGNPFTTCATGH